MKSLADNKTRLTDIAYLIDLSEGNKDFIVEILEMFIRDMPAAVIQMKKYCDNKDWEKLKSTAHKMKPSLSFIGMGSLQKEIQRIENSASERSGLEKLSSIILKTQLEITQAVEELKEELENMKG